jgi:hypothetical protein
MILTVGLEGLLWHSGAKALALSEAVEQGAAQIERRASGEVSEDQVRKAIRTQHATLPFWTVLALIDDGLIEPMAPALRAALAATLLAAAAGLAGRTVGYSAALAACAEAQGIWVLGLAVRTGLALLLGQPEVDTSLTLVVPPGSHSAVGWIALKQLDAFALWGWAAIAVGGWRRGQANLLTAGSICASLALGELTIRLWSALVFGAGMRLTLIAAN